MIPDRGAIADRNQWDGVVVLVVAPTPSHPQDYGNRKRIFRICQMLKAAGARIHYLHYPSEAEWRGKLPLAAQRAMTEAWDGYYTVTPTRPLHPEPEGAYHEVDEWWDPNIGTMMRWLCDAVHPDVVIANYTWMSKCLEFAPHGALKILDTHDRFSERKEVLATLGLRPEFFYTTEEEEAKALARADIVWAIKPQEKAAFEKVCDRPVLTLPHIDPLNRVGQEPQSLDADREIKLGLIGAGNSVNLANFVDFFRVAAPIFQASLAPLKLVVGGSICGHLSDVDYPFLEKYGWIEDIDRFYSDIDVALVPMASSTGLKIKTAEALSYGIPVIAHAHAFEGYKPFHPYHELDSLEAIADACVEVACDPSKYLDDMRFASVLSHRDTADAVTRGMRDTGHAVFSERRFTLVCAHEDISLQGSLNRSLMDGCLDYLGNRSSVMLYIDAAGTPSGLPRLCQTSAVPKIILNPLIARHLTGPEIDLIEAAGASFASINDVMSRFPISQIWFDKIPEAARKDACATAKRVYVNLPFAAQGLTASEEIVEKLDPYLGPFTEVSVLSATHLPIASTLCAELEAEFLKVPSFWLRRCPLAWDLEPSAGQAGFGINVILPSAQGNATLITLLSDILKSVGQPLMNIIEVDRVYGPFHRHFSHGCDYRFLSREALNTGARGRLRETSLTLNLAPHDPFAVMLCSLLDAALHDVIAPTDNELGDLDGVSGGLTLMGFIDIVSRTLRTPRRQRSRAQVLAVQREIDPGWTHVWHQREVLAEGQPCL